MHAGCPSGQQHFTRPLLELADIVRAHGEALRSDCKLTGEQEAVLRAIVRCRTASLGGHVDVCDSCGTETSPSYNSCRNRHCPKCQGQRQAEWVEQRMERILPTAYFHVVFTLPHELGGLCMYNRAELFQLLFASASETLIELGRAPKRLDAEIGVTGVLHTWTRELLFHPHLHCIVTAGGLRRRDDRWRSAPRRYLFPVKVLGALFRGKFLAGLRSLFEAGKLRIDGPLASRETFDAMLRTLYAKPWIVYAKPPFGGPDHVFRYLGRYTHRVGISNHRLRRMDEDGVTFVTRHEKTTTIPCVEFLRRFLLHILPKRFVKIRHYGLMAPSHATTTLERARIALTAEMPAPAPPSPLPNQPIAAPTCRGCGAPMRRTCLPAAFLARSPPPRDTS